MTSNVHGPSVRSYTKPQTVESLTNIVYWFLQSGFLQLMQFIV